MELVLPFPVSIVKDYVCDLAKRHSWDRIFVGGEVVQAVNTGNDIVWFKFNEKGGKPTGDFSLLRSWREYDDGR